MNSPTSKESAIPVNRGIKERKIEGIGNVQRVRVILNEKSMQKNTPEITAIWT